MGLIRSMISLGILLFLVVLGATVPLGERTFFGHLKQIWDAEETQVLVDEVVKKSGPVVDRVKRGVKAGVEEATSDAPEASEDKSAKKTPAEAPANDGGQPDEKSDG